MKGDFSNRVKDAAAATVDSLKAGACDFLVKPLQREATLAKVRKVLRLAAD